MTGNITRRGEHSWRLKFEAGERDPATGVRKTRFVTVRGTKKDAQRELIRLLAEVENGTSIDPSRVTVAEYLREWLGNERDLSPKTLERYKQLAERQVIPYLGTTGLQKLRPAQVHNWQETILKAGAVGGAPLSARTVGHAHRVLHRAYERALALELVSRNPVHAVPAPKPDAAEVEILGQEQMADILERLAGHRLHPVAVFALATGMRRGELCGLAWGKLDLDGATVHVDRSIEETSAGLRFKPPKSRHGRRRISLPASAVEMMREHRRHQLEQRLLLGLGRLGPDDLVFPLPDGSTWAPDKLSRDWGNVVRDRKLPRVTFHALRHSHASALIAAGVDIVTVSRRLGHGSPAITLSVYAHRFGDTPDAMAAKAIDAAMGAKAS